MNGGDYNYIWQASDWPNWRFDLAALVGYMAEVSRAQGLLMGRLADVGMALRDQASLAALTEDVVKTSEIEGEQLNVESVRSSIARRLGVDIGALAPVDRHVEGVVEMVLDATANCQAPVTRERLFGWHAALFPAGYSGLSKIKVGAWRDDGVRAIAFLIGGANGLSPAVRARADQTLAFGPMTWPHLLVRVLLRPALVAHPRGAPQLRDAEVVDAGQLRARPGEGVAQDAVHADGRRAGRERRTRSRRPS